MIDVVESPTGFTLRRGATHVAFLPRGAALTIEVAGLIAEMLTDAWADGFVDNGATDVYDEGYKDGHAEGYEDGYAAARKLQP